MKVEDAMARTIAVASPADTVTDVARLMKQEGCGFIPVTEGKQLVGVVTDRDLVVRAMAAEPEDGPRTMVGQVMTANPLNVIAPDRDLDEAAELMNRQQVRRLAVIDDGKLVGVLSHGNLVQAYGSHSGPADKATHGVTRGA